MQKEAQQKSSIIKIKLFEKILFLYYYGNLKINFQYLIFAIGEFQYITFIWMATASSQQLGFYDSHINFQAFLVYICRLDQVINYQFSKSTFYFLIPLLTITLLFILPLLILIVVKHKLSIFQFTIFRQYFKISSIFCQIFVVTLAIPFISFSLQSLISQLNVDNSSIAIIVFVIITLALIFMLTILIYILCRESIDLEQQCFQKLSQTFLDYIQIILYLIQVIVFAIVDVEKNAIILQSITIILLSLIKIYLVFEMHYIEKSKSNILLLIASFGLVTSFYYLLDTINQQDMKQQTSVGPLLLYICISKSLLQTYYQNEMNLTLSIVQVKQPKLLKFYFAKLINHQFNVLEQNLTGAVIKRWLSQVQDENQNETTQVVNKNINFLETNIDYFIVKKLKQYVKSIIKNKGYDLHYVAFLYKFGLQNLALKQVNQLLDSSRTTNQNKGFINDSENISAEGSKRLTHQSFSSKTMKSNSDDINIIAQRNQNRKSKLFLQGKFQLSSIEASRSLLLKLKIKEVIQTQFYENNKMKSSISEIQLGVEFFLKNEKRNQNLKNAVSQIINDKLIFLQQFTSKKTIDSKKLFVKAKILTDQILKLENKLFQRFSEFSSLKIQSILVFFQAEILNNFLEASKLKTLTSMPDEQLINMDANIRSTFFSKKVVYLNLTLEDNQTLSISRKSENAVKFFQIHQDEIKQFNNIEFILPDAIKEQHSLLVQRFIQTSKSKFYLNSSQTFFKISPCFIKTCDFIFDIHFDSMSHYKFSAFFSESSNQSAYILVDINYFIGGMTEVLFEKMGFHDAQIKQIGDLENQKTSIELLIPNFRRLTDSKIQSALTEFRFLKEDFFNQNDIEKKQTKQQQSLTSTNWSQLEKLLVFESELYIQYYEIYGYYYYVIEIKELKQHQKKSTTQSIKSRNQEGLEQFFELSDLSENEAIANSPKAFRNISKIKNQDDQIDSPIQNESIQINIKQANNDFQCLNQDFISFQEQLILSPNTSNIPWQDSSKIPLQSNFRQIQQDYFYKAKEHSISMNDSKNNNLEEINEELDVSRPKKKRLTDKIMNRKRYEQGEEKQSSSNTELKGIKKSIYYKKYEMISELVQVIQPLTLKLFIWLQELLYLITAIYFIVILVGIQADLTRFIGEIDMIQVHAGIMNPHDLYLQMRQTIFTYQGFLNTGKITQAQYLNVSDPLYQNIAIGYYEFKNGFIQWLSNDYLTPFFKDKNITAWYMLYDATKTYPITQNIREALMATLSYYYQFKLRFEARLSPANQTYQIYQFANVYNFHFWLEDLALEVLSYSKNRSVETKDKWNIIWIIFIFLCVFPLLGSIYYYKLYRSKFDKYLNMFRYCNSFKMENEMEKFKGIMKILNKTPDYLFQYNFNYEMKEENIIFEKQKNDHDQLKAKDIKIQQQFKSLSFFQGFFFIIIGWLVFLSLSIAANIQIGDYLNKYIPTADTYKLLQDMTLYAGTLYRNRDFGLNFPNLPYLRDYDHEKFYVTIYTGLETINTFLEFSYSFDSSRYQVSEDFLQFFQNIQQNDVCETIGDEVLGFLTQYCSKALQGSLRQGLTQTLKFIQTSITLQMSMNNFTKRIEYNFYENEGSLVVMRATQIMSKQFKLGMVDVTHLQIAVSNSISIVFLIYSIFVMIYLYLYLLPNLNKELVLVRRFIQLIPSTVLFLDDQFDRHVRIILASQDY